MNTNYIIASLSREEYVTRLDLEGIHYAKAHFEAKQLTPEDAERLAKRFPNMLAAVTAIFFIDIQLEQGRDWIPLPVHYPGDSQLNLLPDEN